MVHPPRKVPLDLKIALKEELNRLESLKILTPVSEPMPWVSSMIIVKKPNVNTGVCLDAKGLNQALSHNHYPKPKIDNILPEPRRTKSFSMLDIKNGFWHLEIDIESSKFTPLTSPCFKPVPCISDINLWSLDIDRKITLLKNNKATGTDGISPRLLKLAGTAVVGPLTSLTCKAYANVESTITGKWPD